MSVIIENATLVVEGKAFKVRRLTFSHLATPGAYPAHRAWGGRYSFEFPILPVDDLSTGATIVPPRQGTAR